MSRPAVLALTPYLPSPPDTGGRRRMHALIARLSATSDVTVLSFVDRSGEREAVAATSRIASRVVTVTNPFSGATGMRKRLLQLRAMAGRSSFARLSLRTHAMQRAIDDLAAQQRFDLVLVEFAQMAGYTFPASTPVILDEHNVEYDILRRSAAIDRGLVRRAFDYVEYLKLRAEERQAWSRVDACVFTSRRDADLARSAGCDVPTGVVPNGVDVHEFAQASAHTDSDILFFGADFAPNADALRFYADEVLPEVRRQRPSARLVVVGDCVVALRDRVRDGVELVGRVRDVRLRIAEAAVVIAPLRIGGGTRLKILEAMAMGRPVVATRIGAEGIDAVHGRDVLLADDARGLARETVRLLRDRELAETIGANGRDLVTRLYDWDASARQLQRFIHGLVTPRRPYWPAAPAERAS